MPKDGYITLFEDLLAHPAIEVQLNTDFERKMEKQFEHVFNSMPIDVYFEECYGPLPYRSIKFETEEDPSASNATSNTPH
jgi:UDP-galactopyranose mutase